MLCGFSVPLSCVKHPCIEQSFAEILSESCFTAHVCSGTAHFSSPSDVPASMSIDSVVFACQSIHFWRQWKPWSMIIVPFTQLLRYNKGFCFWTDLSESHRRIRVVEFTKELHPRYRKCGSSIHTILQGRNCQNIPSVVTFLAFVALLSDSIRCTHQHSP